MVLRFQKVSRQNLQLPANVVSSTTVILEHIYCSVVMTIWFSEQQYIFSKHFKIRQWLSIISNMHLNCSVCIKQAAVNRNRKRDAQLA